MKSERDDLGKYIGRNVKALEKKIGKEETTIIENLIIGWTLFSEEIIWERFDKIKKALE